MKLKKFVHAKWMLVDPQRAIHKEIMLSTKPEPLFNRQTKVWRKMDYPLIQGDPTKNNSAQAEPLFYNSQTKKVWHA
jgi:hypothetical protein